MPSYFPRTDARRFNCRTLSCLPKSPTVHERRAGYVRLLFSPWNSIVLKSIRFLPLAVAATVTWSPPVLAQSAPPPAASDNDDLEVPANPVTVPGAAAEKPRPESSPQLAKPTPPAAPAKAAASADDSDLRRELAELRLRLDALEHPRVTAAPSSTPQSES